MNTLSLALRNLLRNRRRSLATLLAMVIGLCAILLFGGYAGSTIYAMQTGYVQLHGHLQIQRKDYFLYGSGNPSDYAIADYVTLPLFRVALNPRFTRPFYAVPRTSAARTASG
jgi:putative ABC transport system permease protein